MVNYVTIQRHTSFCKPLKGWNELILQLKDELGMEEVYHFSSATQSKEYQHLELDLIFAIRLLNGTRLLLILWCLYIIIIGLLNGTRFLSILWSIYIIIIFKKLQIY